MANKFMHGSSILLGDNTIPGVQLPKDLKDLAQQILKACKDWGLDFYPTVVQLLTYDEISEIAAYGGFPVRYPHWSFGMEYEELQRGYEYGMHKIFEMVINTNPCYQWLLASNTLLDNLTVIAHATGHNDFFKNNIHFSATDTNMLNNMANHGSRIRKYMSRWGKERVIEFMDYLLRIDTLIDGAKAWHHKVIKNPIISDARTYRHARRLKVSNERLYMEPYINTKEFKKSENEKAEKRELSDELNLFLEPTKDILGFLRDNAPLKPWQQDILSMIYEESIYFFPQRQTKVLNEGWASLTDHVIMAEQGYSGLGQKSHDCGIIEYAAHKMSVLGGKYSTNPYKLGFNLLRDIRDRWDKGRFGTEWEDCQDVRKKENWDTKAGLGKEKIFEVRKYYDDLTLIHEYFTEEFCREQEYFEWKKYNNGETRIESHDYKTIKGMLMRRHVNGGLPDLKLVEPNYRGKGYFLIQHHTDGRQLFDPYVKDVMTALKFIWGNDVFLATNDEDGTEIIYECRSLDATKVRRVTRKKHMEDLW
jgi:stage V sporulation protein R